MLQRMDQVDDDDDTCYICGQSDGSGLSFVVKPCDECERPVCQNCSERDYDMQGDPPQYVCCQWQCEPACVSDADAKADDPGVEDEDE